MKSLYDNGYIVTYNEGDQSLNRDFTSYDVSVSSTFHVVTEGETLLSIARLYYKSSSLWFLIADVNDEINVSPS